MTVDRYFSVTETAKLVRGALAKAFPSVKFSVRSKSYSGGASIDVEWKDGPTDKEVKAVTGQFEGATFDGMIDLKSYTDTMYNGQKVHFGADWIHLHRRFSVELLTSVAERVCRDWGYPMPQIEDTAYFGASIRYDSNAPRISDYSLDQWIRHEACQISAIPTIQEKPQTEQQDTTIDPRVRHFGDWTWVHVEQSPAHDAALAPLGFAWSVKRRAYYAKVTVGDQAIMSALGQTAA